VSVLDDLRAAESRVAKRLKELEPMVAEYRELEAVANRLGIDVAAPKAEAPARSRRARRRTRKAATKPAANAKAAKAKPATARRANARPGERGEQLLELVRARPGITVREAARDMGVDPTSLYRIVRRLDERGDVRKNGRSLEPVGSDK
jgi:DNA-binding NtrC family response regulator